MNIIFTPPTLPPVNKPLINIKKVATGLFDANGNKIIREEIVLPNEAVCSELQEQVPIDKTPKIDTLTTSKQSKPVIVDGKIRLDSRTAAKYKEGPPLVKTLGKVDFDQVIETIRKNIRQAQPTRRKINPGKIITDIYNFCRYYLNKFLKLNLPRPIK